MKRKPTPDRDLLRALRRNLVAIQKANGPRFEISYYPASPFEQVENWRQRRQQVIKY